MLYIRATASGKVEKSEEVTKVHDGFYKFLEFNDGSKKCYYFLNQNTDKNWDLYEINCN